MQVGFHLQYKDMDNSTASPYPVCKRMTALSVIIMPCSVSVTATNMDTFYIMLLLAGSFRGRSCLDEYPSVLYSCIQCSFAVCSCHDKNQKPKQIVMMDHASLPSVSNDI